MRKYVVFLLNLIFSSVVAAQSSMILQCKVNTPQWKSVFQLDAVGAGFLSFDKVGTKESYRCGLKLQDFEDEQRSVVPGFTLKFSRETCVPALPALTEKDVLKKLTVMVTLLDKAKPEGRVQWQLRTQPDACELEKFKLEDLTLNAKKWQERSWGRR